MEYKERRIADISVKKVPDCINSVADIKGLNKVLSSSGSFRVEKNTKNKKATLINCSGNVDRNVTLKDVFIKSVVDPPFKETVSRTFLLAEDMPLFRLISVS